MCNQIRNCLKCEKDFICCPSSTKKFCSHECYSKYPKPENYQDGEAIRERNILYYQNTPKEILQKRWDNIGKAKKVHLTEEEVFKIEEILELGYVKDKRLLMKVAGITNKSCKALNNYISDNPGWYEKYRIFTDQLTHSVQALSPIKFRELLADLAKYSYEHNFKKWDIGPKPQARLRKFYNIKKTHNWSGGETKPEKIVRLYLESLDAQFKPQKYLNDNKFRVDFIKDKKVIEVQGDYWHSNPEIYPDREKLNFRQQKGLKRDKIKEEWLLYNGYEILYIWENDLKKRVEECYTKIENFING